MDMVSKEQFKAYERIRQEGKCNMIMNAPRVIEQIGCTSEQYSYIIEHYSELAAKYCHLY